MAYRERLIGPDGMTRSEIYRLFSGNKQSQAIGAALTLLLRHQPDVVDDHPARQFDR